MSVGAIASEVSSFSVGAVGFVEARFSITRRREVAEFSSERSSGSESSGAVAHGGIEDVIFSSGVLGNGSSVVFNTGSSVQTDVGIVGWTEGSKIGTVLSSVEDAASTAVKVIWVSTSGSILTLGVITESSWELMEGNEARSKQGEWGDSLVLDRGSSRGGTNVEALNIVTSDIVSVKSGNSAGCESTHIVTIDLNAVSGHLIEGRNGKRVSGIVASSGGNKWNSIINVEDSHDSTIGCFEVSIHNSRDRSSGEGKIVGFRSQLGTS